MLLRLTLGLGVVVLAGASAFSNYVHVQHLGMSIIGLVIGAELIKFSALLALSVNAQHGRVGATIAALCLWVLAVTFSFVNTFGNALTRHATEQTRLERARDSATRPAHVILKEVAALTSCSKIKRKDQRAACESDVVPAKRALEAELKLAIAREGQATGQSSEVIAKGDPIRDGLITLAGMFDIKLPRENIFVLVTLMWTLLAEVGSAFGAIAIPPISKRKE